MLMFSESYPKEKHLWKSNFHWLKISLVFAQIFPNNFCIHRMDFCFYAEMISTFAELIFINAEFLIKIQVLSRFNLLC